MKSFYKTYFKKLATSLCLFTLSTFGIAQSDLTECPYFNVFGSDTTAINFALISTDIDATISGVIANVVLEQTYVNSGDSIVDATYVFPMSSNAAVYAMEMQLDDKTIKAEIRRKDEAQTIFDNANEDGLTASLLEQHRPNVFQMSLANIAAGDTLVVRMNYTELLVPKKGIYQFVFPTIVGPRYSTGGEDWVNQSLSTFENVSETTLNIDLKINAGTPLSAECNSHDVQFIYEGNSASTSLTTVPEKDFIVDYTLDGNKIETGLLLYEGEEENFFLSMIQPIKRELGFEIPDREYTFIMDVSGSMNGTPLEVSKRMITNILQDLNPNDKFNIIFFAGGNSVLSENALYATLENIESAISFINELESSGGTHLLPALTRALNMEGTEDYSRTFVILTDGYVTVEKATYELIRNNLNEANFFSFGIGSSVNREIIDGIAYVGEGEAFVATNNEDTDQIADDFKSYISAPALTNISAQFENIEVYDIEPLSIPDVFAERPIIIYGKYNKPAEGSITLTGDYGSGNVYSKLDFSDYDNTQDNSALKYLWARKKIKLMSDYGIASNESDTISIEEEITQLGLKYSLITEYTSFVAVDSSAITTVDPSSEENNGTGGEDVLTSIVDENQTEEFSDCIQIIGNTVNGKLKIKLEDKCAFITSKHLKIFDASGQLITNKKVKNLVVNQNIEIDIFDLSPGVYIVSLYDKDQLIGTDKFVIFK